MTTKVKAYGATSVEEELKPLEIERRELQPKDVDIEILYCGVCHSDLHTVRSDFGPAKYPVVPGHEIIGKVIGVGPEVTRFKLGDPVGVGCMCESCRHCEACHEGLEQYCERGPVMTYGGKDGFLGGHTFGGYSERIVVDEDFVLHIPEGLDLSKAGPLLCAGITTYSPLKHWNVKAGDRVGVIGLGGLGHMGIKLAHAMGAQVVMITRSEDKGNDARLLGADEVLLSTDEQAMRAQRSSFDFLLNTIPVGHDMDPYVKLLKRDATMVLLGAFGQTKALNTSYLIRSRRNIAGSLIGGIAETQEMLDFCARHQVEPEVELIPMQYINKAWDRMLRGDVKYRFVIDLQSLK